MLVLLAIVLFSTMSLPGSSLWPSCWSPAVFIYSCQKTISGRRITAGLSVRFRPLMHWSVSFFYPLVCCYRSMCFCSCARSLSSIRSIKKRAQLDARQATNDLEQCCTFVWLFSWDYIGSCWWCVLYSSKISCGCCSIWAAPCRAFSLRSLFCERRILWPIPEPKCVHLNLNSHRWALEQVPWWRWLRIDLHTLMLMHLRIHACHDVWMTSLSNWIRLLAIYSNQLIIFPAARSIVPTVHSKLSEQIYSLSSTHPPVTFFSCFCFNKRWVNIERTSSK